jgi:hypothetical protein
MFAVHKGWRVYRYPSSGCVIRLSLLSDRPPEFDPNLIGDLNGRFLRLWPSGREGKYLLVRFLPLVLPGSVGRLGRQY